LAHFKNQPLHKRAEFIGRRRDNFWNAFVVARELLDDLRGRARIKGQVVGVMMLGVNVPAVSWHFGIHGVAPVG
jgi:hypothetical protein